MACPPATDSLATLNQGMVSRATDNLANPVMVSLQLVVWAWAAG